MKSDDRNHMGLSGVTTELPRDLMLHPIRLRIVQALVGRRLTAKALKAELGDVPQATLYRQINQLESGGLIEIVHEERVRGGVERTYAVVERAIALGADDVEGATAEDHLRYLATFLGAILSDYGRYLGAGDFDLAADRVGFRQVPMWLTDAELDELVAEVGASVRLAAANEAGPGRQRRLLTTIVMPGDAGPETH